MVTMMLPGSPAGPDFPSGTGFPPEPGSPSGRTGPTGPTTLTGLAGLAELIGPGGWATPGPDPASPGGPPAARPAAATSRTVPRPRGRHVAPTLALPLVLDLPTGLGLLAITALVLGDVDLPVVRPLLAVWLLVLAPTRLLAAKLAWKVGGAERLVLAFAAALLGVLVGALALNTVLPLVGVARPLDPVPTVLAADAALLGLLWWRPLLAPAPLPRPRWVRTGLSLPWPGPDLCLVAASGLAMLLVVAGAVRLNNGGDGTVTVVALIVVVDVFALALFFRHRVREPALQLTVYLQSLTLLLMTSLRGWYITGHDIQREFHVFQLASRAGHWDVNAFHDAYNACLSITLLPSVLTSLTGGPPEAVYKVWTQAVFAVVPLVVYLIARRSSTIGVSLLAVVFFVAFPTYFTDMPFLNRQEVAFLFLAVATLAMVQSEVGVVRRRWLFGVFTTGTVLSHYSTTYVLLGVIMMVVMLRLLVSVAVPLLPDRMRWLDRMRRIPHGRWHPTRLVVGPVNILVLMLLAFGWSSLLTHTDNQLMLTARATLTEVLHPGSNDARSSDVTYNLFSGRRYDPAARMADFRADTLERTATERASGGYLPTSVIDRYPITLTEAPPLTLTPVGRALGAVHIDVGLINTVLRSGAAKLLQVFVSVGLIALALNAAAWFKPPAEMVFLGLASFAVVVSQVVLPQVSVDYGVLRAFQQSLIVLAPFLVTGAITCVRWLRSWAERATVVLTLAFLASLSGLLPQLTGGYPPQLHLNNAGLYYDIYYPHRQERAASDWLVARATAARDDVQFEVETDSYTSSRLPGLAPTDPSTDIFPTLVRSDSYVLLGYATVVDGRAVISYLGDQLIYHYPIELLQRTKNLVYDNGGAEIYR